jgi:hypothetical protein
MLSCLYIFLGRGANALPPHLIQLLLPDMPFYCSASFVLGALLAQLTIDKDFPGASIINTLSFRMQGPAFQHIAGGTMVNIVFRIILELVLAKSVLLCAPCSM